MTLYKYAGPERLDVLRRERIRFTQPAALNDPFELRPYFDRLAPDDQVLGHLSSMDLAPHLVEAYEKQPDDVKAQVSLDVFLNLARTVLESEEGRRMYWETIGAGMAALRDITPWLRDQLGEGLGTRTGILSLSGIADSVLMWSHYASQHRGIVIGLNEAHPWFDRRRSESDEFFHLRPVEYKPPRSDISMIDLDGNDVFLRKGPQWAYEREWRMLVSVTDATETLSGPDGPVYLFSLPAPAVTKLILGARSDQTVRDNAEQLLAESRYVHVQLQRAVLADKTSEIMIEDLRNPPPGP